MTNKTAQVKTNNNNTIDQVVNTSKVSKLEQEVIDLCVVTKELQNENKREIKNNKKKILVKCIYHFAQVANAKTGKVERKYKSPIADGLRDAGFNQAYVDRTFQAVAQPKIMKHIAAYSNSEKAVATRLKATKLTTQNALIAFNSNPKILTEEFKQFEKRVKAALTAPDGEHILGHVEPTKIDNLLNKIAFLAQDLSEKEDQ